MTKKHFLLKDVARRLGIKPYRVVYALTTGLVAEPQLRISNKRIFQAEDIDRLAAHFKIALPTKAGRKEANE
jgi:DNA-binding transcriptional MerR regulator